MNKRFILIGLVVLALISAAGGGWYYMTKSGTGTNTSASPEADANANTSGDSAAPDPSASTPNPRYEASLACRKQAADAPSTDLTKSADTAFLRAIAPEVIAAMKATKVPASVSLAQAILESDSGKSRLARDTNNLFGMKGNLQPGTAGNYKMDAFEYTNGGKSTTTVKDDNFRKYHNRAESIWDHACWLANSGHYDEAMQHTDDPDAFAEAMAPIYATTPRYAKMIIGLMKQHDLYRFDKA